MGGKLWEVLTAPDIAARLRFEEHVIAVVRKHWIAYWRIGLEGVGVFISVWLYLTAASRGSWIFAWLAAGLALHSMWLLLSLQSDVFVLTNRRVFRIQGPLERKFTTLPSFRIVDYSVDQKVLGRLLDYGHFIFESTGDDHDLHAITYVPHPWDRADEIEDVVQKVDDSSRKVSKQSVDTDELDE